MHPNLPKSWVSRAIRVSMPAAAWAVLDGLVARAAQETETGARAVGQVLMALIGADAVTVSEPHWLDFERQKAARLLDGARAA